MTIVNVALPDISEDLNAGIGELQWVLDAFLVALAGLLLLGSGLADRFGRKRVFLAGMAGFGVASVPVRDRPLPGRADRRPGADGRGGRLRAAAGAVADRGHVPARGAPAGARRVGGGRGRGAGARADARRRARERGRLAGGVPRQRAGRDPGRAGRAGRCCRSRRGPALRRSTWSGVGALDRGARRRRVRADRGPRRRLEQPRRGRRGVIGVVRRRCASSKPSCDAASRCSTCARWRGPWSRRGAGDPERLHLLPGRPCSCCRSTSNTCRTAPSSRQGCCSRRWARAPRSGRATTRASSRRSGRA